MGVAAKAGFESVGEYLAKQPEATRKALDRVRAAIRKALPGADEVISYQIPAYKIEGSAQVGRGNAIMAAQVKQFSNAELKAIAQFLGSLPADVHTVAQSKFR